MPKLRPIAVLVICALSFAGCAITPPKQAKESPGVPPAAAPKPVVTAQGMYRVGRYYEGQARYEKAVAAYREALKRDPLLVDAYTGLGMALAALGRHDEAIRQFQAAVVLAPHAAHTHNNLGYAYLLSGARQDAVKALEEARRLDPGHEKARENLRAARPEAPDMRSRLHLIEVAPAIFELRAPVRPRKIEAAPLAPLPRTFKLEVSNGNGITGMAKRVAGYLASDGIPAARLTNQRPFDQARTEVQYRDGYAAEAAKLAAKLPQPARLVRRDELAEGIDVRLLLGKDLPLQVLKRSSRRSSA